MIGLFIGFFIGLLAGAGLGFGTCALVITNTEDEKQSSKNIDGLSATSGDEWNTDVEDIDE